MSDIITRTNLECSRAGCTHRSDVTGLLFSPLRICVFLLVQTTFFSVARRAEDSIPSTRIFQEGIVERATSTSKLCVSLSRLRATAPETMLIPVLHGVCRTLSKRRLSHSRRVLQGFITDGHGLGICSGNSCKRYQVKTMFSDRKSLVAPLLLDRTTTVDETEEALLNPLDAFRDEKTGIVIPFPTSLSPSSAAEFRACPQNYLFQNLWNIRRPKTLALAKGSMCHAALERIYDLVPEERTLEHLQGLLRTSWGEVRLTDEYRNLFMVAVEDSEGNREGKQSLEETSSFHGRPGDVTSEGIVECRLIRDLEAERKWGREALRLLDNYYNMEDPKTVLPPNPLKRELWVKFHLAVDPNCGVTASSVSQYNEEEDQTSLGDNDGDEQPRFLVRGIVDRLDLIRVHDNYIGNGTIDAFRITDYKTGKAPNFKYTQEVNRRIAEDNFWQLKVYALLMREMLAVQVKGDTKVPLIDLPGNCTGFETRKLRLMYLTSDSEEGMYIDMDLGKTKEERDAVLHQVHRDLSEVWTSIQNLVRQQDPTVFRHCDRAFCNCHKVRPRFVPGTVWRTSMEN